MSLENHHQIHYSDLPPCRPVFGEITGIYDKDNPENWSEGALTLYQVTTRQQWPTTEEVLPPCAVLNQLYGLANGQDSFEDTLTVGTQVVVGFLEWDPNRPVIMGRAWTWDTQAPASSAADQPITTFRRRDTELTIDKDGNASIQLAAEKSFTVKDSGGNVVFELVYTSGAYRVNLGGDAGLEKLIKEAAADVYNNHTHGPGSFTTPAAGGGGGPVTGTSAGPSDAIGSAHMTDVTRAK